MSRKGCILFFPVFVMLSSFVTPSDHGWKVDITNLRNNDGIKKAAPLQEPLL